MQEKHNEALQNINVAHIEGNSAVSHAEKPNINRGVTTHGLTLTPTWISNYMYHNIWDENTFPFPDFNGATVEVWEWISNFIPHFTEQVITYRCWNLS